MDGMGFSEGTGTHGNVVVVIARFIGILVLVAAVIVVLMVCMFVRHFIFMCIDSFGILPIAFTFALVFVVVVRMGYLHAKTFSKLFRKLCH